MLIRSQKKTLLVNMDNVASIFANNGNVVVDYVNSEHDSIANYSTEEKAIKVLDMIQEEYTMHLYSNGGALATVDAYVQSFGFIPPKIFQMPQESEV